MNEDISLDIGDDPVKFTAEGKVSVLDAIRAVSGSGNPRDIWDRMKEDYGDILDHCESYEFAQNDPTTVINSQGWERIWDLLPEYIFESHP